MNFPLQIASIPANASKQSVIISFDAFINVAEFVFLVASSLFMRNLKRMKRKPSKVFWFK